MDKKLYELEERILDKLIGRFVEITDDSRRKDIVETTARQMSPSITDADINAIYEDINDISIVKQYVEGPTIEDIMINNLHSIFVYDSKTGYQKLEEKFDTKEDLDRFVSKLKLYATNKEANGNIMDVHMYNGSRANIITSPLGYDVTIRNFKRKPLSIIDLINLRTIDYRIAGRLWIYTDGFRIRPANILLGGVPAAGKTTLLNTMFSFFRPEQRIVTIEETYELDTSSQDNTVRLETNTDLPMNDLVRNALRMRPDIIIIGEVRGPEANAMAAAMNIGKICMGTIHASSSRDIITRLEHAPMNVPRDILPVIDALIVSSVVYQNNIPTRKIIQISEISGIETQILLSDLFKYDYKTHEASAILPSVTYRDTICKILGVAPPDLLAEEVVRSRILEQLNRLGHRDMHSISEAVKEYYDNPERLLTKLGLQSLAPAIKV